MTDLRPIALILLAITAALAGCGDRSGGAAASDSATASNDVDPALAGITPTDPSPLGPELESLAQLIRAGRSGPARVRLKKYLMRHPNDGKAMFLFGLTYHKEMKYDEARLWYTRAIDLDEAYSPVYHFDGWAAYYLGDMSDARRSFRRHLAWQPREADSHFGLGVVEMEEGRHDEAEVHLLQSIDLLEGQPAAAKGVSKARARLGDIAMQRGDLPAARVEYEKAVAIYPDHYEVFHKLSRVYERLEMPDEAETARAQYAESRGRVRPDLGPVTDEKPADPEP